MLRQKQPKIDTTFFEYYTEDDLKPKVTIDRIRRLNKLLAKDDIFVYSYYLEANKDMSQGERTYCEQYVKFLRKEEERKFIKAIEYIEGCQQQPKTD